MSLFRVGGGNYEPCTHMGQPPKWFYLNFLSTTPQFLPSLSSTISASTSALWWWSWCSLRNILTVNNKAQCPISAKFYWDACNIRKHLSWVTLTCNCPELVLMNFLEGNAKRIFCNRVSLAPKSFYTFSTFIAVIIIIWVTFTISMQGDHVWLKNKLHGRVIDYFQPQKKRARVWHFSPMDWNMYCIHM